MSIANPELHPAAPLGDERALRERVDPPLAERVVVARPVTTPMPQPVPHSGIGLLTLAAILALLYFGRPILVPVMLAVLLSFAIAPVVRQLRRVGLGHVSSVLVAVLAAGAALLALAGVIGVQTVEMASNLSQYEATIKTKVETLRGLTVSSVRPVWGAAERLTSTLGAGADLGDPVDDGTSGLRAGGGIIPVEIHEPPAGPAALAQRVLAAAAGPIGMTGIVAIVLIFVLLEQEALRDRFIRLAGGADLRAATTAINDAGERLSRFFLRQFAVNFGVGIAVWAALALIGLPHAVLWGALTAVLRFVPYLGVPVAASLACFLAFAVDPGWTLLLLTLGAFMAIQMVVGQVIEPRLYGHATGLSPLSIVLSTLFWGWLWGPIGVIMSTPLTLCLAVAGRHTRSLGFLDIVLGDGPALTMPQKFYQRALSGDSAEIIEGAREFLKRKPFATYCDTVLMPALSLGRADLAAGAISQRQQHDLRNAIVSVVEALGSATQKGSPRRQVKSLIEESSPGFLLREQRLHRQQGSPADPALGSGGSTVLCIGLHALGDDLATELLVRILRDMHIDARHLAIDEVGKHRPATLKDSDISAVCVVSVDPRHEKEMVLETALRVRAKLPHTFILALQMRGVFEIDDRLPLAEPIDRLANSLEDAAMEIAERLGRTTDTPNDKP